MKRKQIPKKHLKIIIPIIILVGIVILFAIWTMKPKNGTVTPPTATSKSLPSVGDKSLDGTYITFTYSGKYIDKDEGPSNNELEIHTLTADTHYDKQIIVSVSNLPDGALNSYGNYILRKVRTDLYTARKVTVDGISAEMWVKKDGTEQTVFVPHGNKVATIAFGTASANDQLTAEVDALIKTFHWKQ